MRGAVRGRQGEILRFAQNDTVGCEKQLSDMQERLIESEKHRAVAEATLLKHRSDWRKHRRNWGCAQIGERPCSQERNSEELYMSKKIHVQTNINGSDVDLLCESRQSLLEVLRDVLNMTGTKEGCNDGNCGACSVIVDGRLIDSCLMLGVEAEGKMITTIEGVAYTHGLHPIQQAFLENAALQCGICTPGFIVAAKSLLEREPEADEAREFVTGWLATYAGARVMTR